MEEDGAAAPKSEKKKKDKKVCSSCRGLGRACVAGAWEDLPWLCFGCIGGNATAVCMGQGRVPRQDSSFLFVALVYKIGLTQVSHSFTGLQSLPGPCTHAALQAEFSGSKSPVAPSTRRALHGFL
jgi:hypothetical protein